MTSATKNNLLVGVLLLAVALLASLTWQRNKAWENNLQLFSTDIPNLEDCARAHYHYANALLLEQQKNPNLANAAAIIHHYQSCIEIAEDSYNARLELGKFLVNSNRVEEASPYLEELVAYFPDEGRPYYHLGYCRYFQERFDEAIALFERSIALAPNREDVYQYMAWSYFRKGDIPQAIAILKDRIEESPQEVTHYTMVSDFYFASENPEEGHKWLDTAIALFPDQTALYLKRIQRYEEGGNLEKANFYRQALSQASR